MIQLFQFAPALGLPNASPFCMKVETYLRMAGLPFECVNHGNPLKGPRGKLPYIDDGGTKVADSTFIRLHLEDTRRIDFDAGLTPEQRGVAWAVEKMLEDHLYWALVDSRWTRDADFDHGPRRFFDAIPGPVRPMVIGLVRRQVKRNLWGHGLGRHERSDIERLAARSIESVAAVLGDKPFLAGDQPCGADATVFAFILGLLCQHFDGPTRDVGLQHANLVAYRDRGLALWYPDFKTS